MKPNFKIDFKKRDVISMICFTFVMIIVLVLGNTFGFVSAYDVAPSGYIYVSELFNFYPTEQNILPYTYPNFQSSSIYFDYKNLGGAVFGPDDMGLDNLVSKLLDGDSSNGELQIPTSVTSDNVSYNVSDYPNFLIKYNVSDIELYLFDSSVDSLVYSNYASYDRTTYLYFLFNTSGNMTRATVNKNSGDSYSNDGITYYFFQTGTNTPLYSNMHLYLLLNSSSIQPGLSVTSQFVLGNTDFIDSNFMYESIHNNGGGSVSSENDTNNMYLEDCKFTFSFNKYVDSVSNDPLTYSHNWGGGYINFSAMLNDYQYNHINNFSVKFDFQVLVKGVGTLHQEDNDPVPTESENDFYGNFYYTTTIPLSDLSNGSYSWRFSDLTGNLTDSSSVINGSNISHLDSFIANMTEYIYIDWSYWKLYCTAHLTSNGGGTTDSSRIDSYNFVTGASSVVSDSLGTNYNPYVDDSGNVSGDDQHNESNNSNNSSQTITNGYSTVTQNNNQNVTVNNNVNSSEVTNQLDQILGSTGSDSDTSDGGLTDSFLEKTNSNSWLQLMSSTFGFVPASIWIDLGVFLVVVLGILAAFLILRFLLDLL